MVDAKKTVLSVELPPVRSTEQYGFNLTPMQKVTLPSFHSYR